LRAEYVERLENDRLQNLQLKGSAEEALGREVDQVNFSPFTDEVEQANPLKWLTLSITLFKGDFDPERHLKHFKSAMILYKADDALMCKVLSIEHELYLELIIAPSQNLAEFFVTAERHPLWDDDQAQGLSLQKKQRKDLIGLDLPHNDALIICIQIGQAMVERVHVDEGSATNIVQLSVVRQMILKPNINKLARSLTGLNGATSITVNTVDLDIYSPLIVCSQAFMVIDEVSPYNGILGQPWISKIDIVASVTHQKILYPISEGKIGQIN
ncbi:unnamed protein product, partial [Prunus brigantina]